MKTRLRLLRNSVVSEECSTIFDFFLKIYSGTDWDKEREVTKLTLPSFLVVFLFLFLSASGLDLVSFLLSLFACLGGDLI